MSNPIQSGTHRTPKPQIDWVKISDRVHAAYETRCPCGDTGSWEHTVSGKSEDKPCIWAGCPNCGSTVGRPLLRPEYNAWRKLPLTRQRELIASAAVRRVFGDTVATITSAMQYFTIDDVRVAWTQPNEAQCSRVVKFVPDSILLAENIAPHS